MARSKFYLELPKPPPVPSNVGPDGSNRPVRPAPKPKPKPAGSK